MDSVIGAIGEIHMRRTIASAMLAVLAWVGFNADVSAQTRRRHAPAAAGEPVDLGSSVPLTVNRRSWLDSGNAVSSRGGAGPSYVAANTILNKTQDQIFAPDRFGNDVIQGPPYVPGRSQPVIEGSLPASGRPIIDNVLVPQNFSFDPAPSVP